MADVTDQERRAFEFGPEMRGMARDYCEGSLPEAHRRFSSPQRVAQHEEDRAAIRPNHRAAFIEAIREAGGFKR